MVLPSHGQKQDLDLNSINTCQGKGKPTLITREMHRNLMIAN